MPKSDKSWINKWQSIIDRIGQQIAKDGREMVVINVQAQMDVKK